MLLGSRKVLGVFDRLEILCDADGFMLLGSKVPRALDGLVTTRVGAVEVVEVVTVAGVVVGEGSTSVLIESIELVGKIVICGTKEETDV